MNRIAALTLAAALSAGPALSQIGEPPSEEAPGDDDGFNLMEEGARMFMRGLQSQMDPAMDELRGMAEDMQPVLRQFSREMGAAFVALLDRVDDIAYYQAPEILDNGDIIIRRKPDAPPWEAEPDGLPEDPDLAPDETAPDEDAVDL